MAKGGSGSHWDGCEEAHHDCALAKLREAQAVIERLGELGDAALRAERAYCREMLDPASSPQSRCDAAAFKNEATSRWDAQRHTETEEG
jgi:hypothetical protein